MSTCWFLLFTGMPHQQPPISIPPPGHPPAPAPHVNPAFFPPQHGGPPPTMVRIKWTYENFITYIHSFFLLFKEIVFNWLLNVLYLHFHLLVSAACSAWTSRPIQSSTPCVISKWSLCQTSNRKVTFILITHHYYDVTARYFWHSHWYHISLLWCNC